MDGSLGALAQWIMEQPDLAVLLLFGTPAAVGVVARLLARGGAPQSAEPAAPRPAPPEPRVEPTRPVSAEPIAAEPEPQPPLEPAPEPAEPEVAEPAPAPPGRLSERLRRTSDAFVGRIGSLLSGGKVDDALLDELEALLMGADLGVRTADDLLQRVRSGTRDAASVRATLREGVLEKLRRVEPEPGSSLALAAKPHVILVLGVNGSGKTTTIGKLAAHYVAAGRRVVLGAGDTFRPAAIEQLEVWAERVGCDIVAGQPGSDASAVAFDAVKAGGARDADVVIVDTAGRLQTRKPLMEELGKLARVIGKCQEGAPHETLLVLDSNTGQNAISQAKLFSDVADVTGIALTKLDGTAKGGVIVGLADELGIPVRYVGVGEAVEDLRDFVAEDFVAALFDEGGGGA